MLRKRAMETIGQTSKRSKSDECQDDKIKERKKRRTDGDTLAWLEKKKKNGARFEVQRAPT